MKHPISLGIPRYMISAAVALLRNSITYIILLVLLVLLVPLVPLVLLVLVLLVLDAVPAQWEFFNQRRNLNEWTPWAAGCAHQNKPGGQRVAGDS